MNTVEHKKYIKDFKEYIKKIISSKKESKSFLLRAGIHTPKGNLNKNYTYTSGATKH
ncbi:MAG: hypothetical protein WD048_05505 [Chitinophagales bacterium]